MKTVVAVFRSPDEARAAIRDVRASGTSPDDLSLVSSSDPGTASELSSGEVVTDVAADAGIGAALGGIGGLLLGFTALVIPGIGPVMAAGPLIAALGGAGVGAVAGGLIGALSEAGVPEAEANVYAAQVRSGGVLVTVRTDDAHAERVRDALDRHGAVDIGAEDVGGKGGDQMRPELLEGPGNPSECDLRTENDMIPPAGRELESADVIGHNPGGEAMSADETRREYVHYRGGDKTSWPHQKAYDAADSLVRPEVLRAEQDPIAEADLAGDAVRRSRIY